MTASRGYGRNPLRQENRFQMPFVQIGGDIAGDGRVARIQHVQVTPAEFGRHLVAHVDQLPERGIILPTFVIVSQRAQVWRRGPFRDGAGRKEFRALDVDDTCVGSTKLFAMGKRLRVNFFCEHQAASMRW